MPPPESGGGQSPFEPGGGAGGIDREAGGTTSENEDIDEDEDMARGGIVMRPRIARVGERGPEAVMKLGPRMPGGWEVPMRPAKLPYENMRYTRKGELGI
jgi:hypothetical protein